MRIMHVMFSSMLRVVKAARQHPDAAAVLEGTQVYQYAEVYHSAVRMAERLLEGRADLQEACVAYQVPPGFGYVRTLWGIWLAGGIAVPISLSHPLPAIEQLLEDTGAEALVVSRDQAVLLQETASRMGIRLICEEEPEGKEGIELPVIHADRAAMILYTSGTTSRPKGVVLSHANLEAQMRVLIEAWGWKPSDHILCVLPLHHVHGIVNVVGCALFAGARLEFLPSFSPQAVFDVFLRGSVNLFMAVPTIYFKLANHYDSLPLTEQQRLTESMRRFRLMVCGSAALPVSVMDRWESISGQRLLERYGMTEIGMALSNPLDGERRAGTVGQPLPGVCVRIVDEQGQDLPPGAPGEILVQGPNVFRSYWQRPEVTEDAFTKDGWFRTGDVAVLEDGYYRILGRLSTDIIKSGGYKISALEIEESLRGHPLVSDCAVTSLPDEEWGERIVVALVGEAGLCVEELDGWLRERLPRYKLPRQYLLVAELPRNAMGKVVKGSVKALF